MKNSIINGAEFLASANSFSGFRSYFNNIFNPADFTRLFILKGGPGTGKSSILKKLCAYAKENALDYEIFRCSSDPNSLDGIIIEKENKRVGVIDGTAPHQRDAALGGAFDELLNLGEAWDAEGLQKERETICELNDKKAHSYKKAYEYLSFSSVFDSNIMAEMESTFNKRLADNFYLDIIRDYASPVNRTAVRLISSFSKNGYLTNRSINELVKNKIAVHDSYGSSLLFLTQLVKKAEDMGVSFTKFPTPLNDKIYEAIYFSETDTLIYAAYDGQISGNDVIDTGDFFGCSMSGNKDIQILDGSRKLYTALAKEQLALASDYHFALERIYTPKMNFGIVDELFDKMLTKIKNIFSE